MGTLRRVASIATFGLVSWRSTREKKRRAETKLLNERAKMLGEQREVYRRIGTASFPDAESVLVVPTPPPD